MRFPSKKSFVRASVLFIFAMPTLAFAVTPEEQAKLDAIAEKAKDLDLDAAKNAFGDEFGIADVDGVFTLYGGTSTACRSAFNIVKSEEKGTFRISYDGTNDDCLDYDKALAAKPKTPFVSLSGGDKSEDGKMKPTGTFKKVNLVVHKKNSSKGAITEYELKDGDKSLAHKSDKDAKADKLTEETRKKALDTDKDIQLVTKCIRGMKELDVGSEALDRLLLLPETMKTAIAAAKGEDWLTDAQKNILERQFKACKIQFSRAKAESISEANCDERLKKIAKADESYVGKIKDLYVELIARQMRDATNGTRTIAEAYEESVAILDKLRDEDAFALTADDLKELLAVEKNFNLHFLRLAAMKGSNSEEFIAMKDRMLEYMLGDDTNECLITETGAVNPKPVKASACTDKVALSRILGEQIVLANGNQAFMDKQAALLAQQEKDRQKEASDLQACSANLASATDAQKKFCTELQAKVDARNSAAANGSLNTAANGWGTTTTTPATTTSNTTTTTAPNAFFGTGYPVDKAAADPAVKSAAPAKENVTVNTVPATSRHLFR